MTSGVATLFPTNYLERLNSYAIWSHALDGQLETARHAPASHRRGSPGSGRRLARALRRPPH